MVVLSCSATRRLFSPSAKTRVHPSPRRDDEERNAPLDGPDQHVAMQGRRHAHPERVGTDFREESVPGGKSRSAPAGGYLLGSAAVGIANAEELNIAPPCQHVEIRA